jgi:hypothetical protein
MPFPAFLASKFALKFMLTILVFEIKEGKNATPPPHTGKSLKRPCYMQLPLNLHREKRCFLQCKNRVNINEKIIFFRNI